MKTYVINLPRARDRRETMERQLANSGLDYEFVTGIDGGRLSPAERAALVDETEAAKYPWWLTPGAIGCVLSHRRVYQLVAEQDQPALVLEDDAILDPDLAAVVNDMLPLVPSDGLVLLNFRSKKPCRLVRDGVRCGAYELLAPVDPYQVLSGLAYIVGPRAAAKMAEVAVPVRWASDSWHEYLAAGAVGSLRCVLPRPVKPSPAVRSSTRHAEALGLRDRVLGSPPGRLVRGLNRRRVAWQMNRVVLVDQ